jgi:serine/threonine protein kinase
MKMPADRLFDPLIRISDFGTSFIWPSDHSPQLHCPPLYLPPEDFFQEPITLAADVWTTGLTLYEILGERPLLESFASDRDDLLADMMSTLGLPPTRWWDQWASRKEFFKMDGTWLGDPKRIYDPGWRPLRQRLWQMGRGETPETCEWDVASGELQALEDLLKGMLKFEPAERLTAEQMMESEYMVKWAMPAWERQLKRTEG